MWSPISGKKDTKDQFPVVLGQEFEIVGVGLRVEEQILRECPKVLRRIFCNYPNLYELIFCDYPNLYELK